MFKSSNLSSINTPSDLRKLTVSELQNICDELRTFVIDEILANGGHFSANLGTIELTVALHTAFNTPTDKLIWDVGHQAYAHKILTGRKANFASIRKKDGYSGFPKRSENEADAFGTGHSSTSISAALGFAESARIQNLKRKHIAVIGDGSLTGGMAWEALFNGLHHQTDLLIVINDNQMSIDPNESALTSYLKNLGVSKGKEQNFFEALGFEYVGVDDGHNFPNMLLQAQKLQKATHPRIWHLKTVKGKGYAPAEKEKTKWHAVKYVKVNDASEVELTDKFQTVFGQTLVELANLNRQVVGITPAMPSGCSMNYMLEQHPARSFDVGIAEQHAVTFSAGLAADGLRPFCNIYSTFLQRAYDQVIHDVCIQNLPVIFCLDRAGNVGEDGATHHGMFDIAFLRCIPNLIVSAPKDAIELRNLMFTALHHKTSPFVIRYPKGEARVQDWKLPFERISIGKAECLITGSEAAILSFGALTPNCIAAVNKLQINKQMNASVYHFRFVKPLDLECLKQVFKKYSTLLTVEDGCKVGGFGSAVLEAANAENYKGRMEILGYKDSFYEQGTREEILAEAGLDAEGIYKSCLVLIDVFKPLP
jgi:1-deoxy-D-xylulose-5-phosphate synthase